MVQNHRKLPSDKSFGSLPSPGSNNPWHLATGSSRKPLALVDHHGPRNESLPYEVGNSLHMYWQVGNSLHIYWQGGNSAYVGCFVFWVPNTSVDSITYGGVRLTIQKPEPSLTGMSDTVPWSIGVYDDSELS